MKDFILNVLTILLCLHGLAWKSVNRQGPVAKDIVAAYDQKLAHKLPRNIRNSKLEYLFYSKKTVQFRMNGMIFRFRWIGERSRMLNFNGRIFSLYELSDEKRFMQAFRAKFGFKSPEQHAGLWNWLMPQAHASAVDGLDEIQGDSTSSDSTVEDWSTRPFFDARFQSEESDETSEVETSDEDMGTHVFVDAREDEEDDKPERDEAIIGIKLKRNFKEKAKSVTDLVKKTGLFEEDSLLADTGIGQQFAMSYKMLTGSDRKSLDTFLFGVMNSFATGMYGQELDNPMDFTDKLTVVGPWNIYDHYKTL